jgi:hypothetical protein
MATSTSAFSVLALPSVKTFKEATNAGAFHGRKNLEKIDTQLGKTKAVEANTDLFVNALKLLIGECQLWVIAKQKKFAHKTKTKTYLKRFTAVENLSVIAALNLKYASFQKHKNKGKYSNLTGLAPGFQRERKEFEHMRAQTYDMPNRKDLSFDPHSASFVAAGTRDLLDPDIGPGILKSRNWTHAIESVIDGQKRVEDMDDEEFREMHRQLRSNYGGILAPRFLPLVHYVRKKERINNNMLIALGGLLYKDSALIPYNSSGKDQLDIYAIDKYGNIMVAPADGHHGNTEYRHSSLNAGNDVICAGRMEIVLGVVKLIDNWSGHYKPSRQALVRACACLRGIHNLNLKFTKIKVYSAATLLETTTDGEIFSKSCTEFGDD